MRVQAITIFPELFEPFVRTSLVGRAIAAGVIDVRVHDLRDFTTDRHRVVDDEPYGGGGGMVMLAEPWLRAVESLSSDSEPWRILLSPQGRRLDEAKVAELSRRPDLLLLCGRYEAIDERVQSSVVDEEISIGDYVVAGGELPAMVLIEAMSRQIPGVVGKASSVDQDSFRHGILDHPHYTRPRLHAGMEVPEVLLSGDHAAIDSWRRAEALRATLHKRPDLLHGAILDDRDRETLERLSRAEGGDSNDSILAKQRI